MGSSDVTTLCIVVTKGCRRQGIGPLRPGSGLAEDAADVFPEGRQIPLDHHLYRSALIAVWHLKLDPARFPREHLHETSAAKSNMFSCMLQAV